MEKILGTEINIKYYIRP